VTWKAVEAVGLSLPPLLAMAAMAAMASTASVPAMRGFSLKASLPSLLPVEVMSYLDALGLLLFPYTCSNDTAGYAITFACDTLDTPG